MVFLGRVKNLVGPDFRDDGLALEHAGICQALLGFFGDPALLLVMVEDRGPVLFTAIHELAVRVGGVDVAPEILHQVLVAHLARVEEDLDGFQMAGLPGGIVLVGRIDLRATRKAREDARDARRLLEVGLGVQKQPPAKVATALPGLGLRSSAVTARAGPVWEQRAQTTARVESQTKERILMNIGHLYYVDVN